jgi:uncharacterized membrane protein YhaH (DUF805 family)
VFWINSQWAKDVFWKYKENNMADLRNKYGEVVYRLEGDRINDIYGNWKFTIVGDRINDTYGNWKYDIRGGDLFDTYGNRIGGMNNLADILPNPKDTNNSGTPGDNNNAPTRKSRKKPEGVPWVAYILFWLLFWFLSPFYDNIKYFRYIASRKEWWGTLVRMFLLMMYGCFVLLENNTTVSTVSIVVGITSIPIILASIRRIRDIGKPWWWVLIPFANLILCGFFPGKE